MWIQCGSHTESRWICFDLSFGSAKTIHSIKDSMWFQCRSPRWIPLNSFRLSLWIPHKTPSIQYGLNVDSMRIPSLNPIAFLWNFSLESLQSSFHSMWIQCGFNTDPHIESHWISFSFLFEFFKKLPLFNMDSMSLQCGSPHWIPVIYGGLVL